MQRDPIGFGKIALLASASLLRERFKTPTLASGLAAIFLVLTAVLLVTLMDRVVPYDKTAIKETDAALVEILTIPKPDQPSVTSGTGVGTGSKGRVAFDRGKGGIESRA